MQVGYGGGSRRNSHATCLTLIYYHYHYYVLQDDAYNPYIRGLGKTHSVATLLTKSRQAGDDDAAIQIIAAADAIFFAGGDQWTYLQEWQGTALQKTVQKLIQERNIPVGGTSAGCDIQGGEIYTAANDTVVSKEALRDPYNFRVTLQPFPFINHTAHLLAHAIVDTHFITRDRMGRLVAFLARLWHDHGIHAVGIGIDEQTAIAIDAQGRGTMMRQGREGGRAFVLTPSHPPSRCTPGEALEWSQGLVVQKLDAHDADTFDFVAMRGGSASQRYPLSARDGELHPSDPYSPHAPA